MPVQNTVTLNYYHKSSINVHPFTSKPTNVVKKHF